MGKTDKKTGLTIEYIDVTKLKPYEKNARRHEEYDISQIAKSIEAYGFNDPIGIWGKDNQIVEGHGRLLAAKSLGMKEVPCIRLDDLTDEQRREYTIMHNKTAELSTWDFDMLEKELSELDFGEFDVDWGIEFQPGVEELDGGGITDNSNTPIQVVVRFKSIKEFRQQEEKIREFLDAIPNATVSVGGENEDK